LGVGAALGETLGEEDLAAPGRAVLTYAFWERAFGRDPTVLGRTLRLGDKMYTIAGVAGRGFSGLETARPVDFFIPITGAVERQDLNNRDAFMFHLMARLRPGVDERRARADLEVLFRQIRSQWYPHDSLALEVTPASGGLIQLRRRFSRPLGVLMAMVGL